MPQSHNSFPVSSGPSPSPSLSTPPAPEGYYEVERGHTLREYFDILIRRKWWIIGTVLALFSVAALYTFTRTPIYRATATFEINNDNPGAQVSLGGGMMGMGSWFYAQKFQETQYKILKSRSLALRVIDALNLMDHPEYSFLKEESSKLSPAEIEDMMVLIFSGGLSVEPVRNTYLVDVSYQSTDKNLAQKVLDVIANQYMYLLIDRRNESYALVRNWLNKQLNEMAGKVHEAQKKLFKFGQKTDIYNIDENISVSPGNAISSSQSGNVVYQKFVDLSALLTKAQSEVMSKKAQYEQLKSQGVNAPLVINNPLIAALRQELVVQQAKVSGLDKVYLKGHPELQAESAKLAELNSRVNAEARRIQESAKADYEAADRTEHLLRESLETQKQQMANLQENLSNYQILRRDAQTNEQLYQALLARVKEANISSTMVASNVSVIDPAPLPTIPFKPKTFQNLALALTLGLVLGVGLALLVEAVDDSIKSTEDLEKRCNLPLLGALPALGSYRELIGLREEKQGFWGWRFLPSLWPRQQALTDDTNLDLVVYEHPQDPLTEALRHMQTSIMLSVSGRPPAAIMVTSPNPSEGKTMVASNLAISLALNGRPTVIMDCDLRKPRVHKIFDLKAQPGITNYLTGNASREEILRQAAIPNLTVIPAGPQSPSPNNLLNSEMFKDLLAQLRQEFSHIIIDTPPILGFSDARLISVLVDGSLLVTRFNSTHKSAARLAVQLLGQINAPLMGGVVNFVDSSGGKYGAYHYYNYKLYSKYYRGD
jgi:polysaccharide biosynthesis transport protein